MIVRVNKGVKVNQRALIIKIIAHDIYIRLLGTDEHIVVQPQHIAGIELNEHLIIKFNYVGYVLKS